MSLESSRENSSTDLSGKTKEKRKNVHFNKDRSNEALNVSIRRPENTRQDTLHDEAGPDTIGGAQAASPWKATNISSTQHEGTGRSLFFLEEDDEEDSTDVLITPFKKTGKIKTVSNTKPPVSPALLPDASAGAPLDGQDSDPFLSKIMDEHTSESLADRRSKRIDIPMIQLPPANLELASSRPHNVRGSSSFLKAPSTPGTPADGMVGMFSNGSVIGNHSSDTDQTPEIADTPRHSLSTRLMDENQPLNPDMVEEHRRMNIEAYKLVRAHTIQHDIAKRNKRVVTSTDTSRRNSFASATDSEARVGFKDQLDYLDANLPTKKANSRGGVLSNLMQLYNTAVYQQPLSTSRPHTGATSSGTSTPKWHQRNSQSNTSLVALLGAGQSLGTVGGLGAHSRNSSSVSLADIEYGQRPNLSKMRKHSGGLVGAVRQSFHRPRIDAELQITMAIADVLQRQKFIIKLCRSLMLFGAPTHRLEDYLKITSRSLEIDAQFLYIPGCMIVAFDDKSTHTTDVKIVRVNQGTDLGKLNEVHTIYKNVIHAVIDVEQGIVELDQQLEIPQLYRIGFVLIAYGLASVCVGPFAFGSSFIDLPIQFILGFIVGVLQLVVAPRSQLYANVFEILATICVSFIGRGFGSIPRRDGTGNVFCFAALAQSAICLILPGYAVLCGALELQSKSIVAGSVRLFYAIVYSLFLSFGITIGSVLYGWMDAHATQATTCSSDISDWYRFLFVPLFALCLLIVNQAKPRQAPVALAIASAGYATNYFTNRKFGVAQVSNAISAFVIGCLGNLYSRIGHGLAFTAVLPSIFVQVPSGLASSSSLVSGLELANLILNNTANSTGSVAATTTVSGTGALQFGYDMIQIAIGITVGLFASALVVYIPLCGAEKRSGMLTF